jgi:hypothetical protein
MKTCQHCSAEFQPLRRSRAIYCSPRCRGTAWARKNNTNPTHANCALCGIEFRRVGRQRHCSGRCRSNSWAKRWGKIRYRQNPQASIRSAILWAKNNPERRKKYREQHYAENRAAYLTRAKFRKKAVRRAMPPWLGPVHIEQIRVIYAESIARGLHVDHIVPLQGKTVSGLHVPWNLQLLTREENRQKSNKHVA